MLVSNYTPGTRPSILIVDDYADARDVWTTVLDAEGFDVQTAATGQEALDVAESSHPNLVVLDLGLPDLHGIDVARRLRLRDGKHRLRLVALTGCSDPEELDAARAAGFDALFIKPCVPSELVAEIHRLLAA
jgi:two-component system, cell cycle response regulator DivK